MASLAAELALTDCGATTVAAWPLRFFRVRVTSFSRRLNGLPCVVACVVAFVAFFFRAGLVICVVLAPAKRITNSSTWNSPLLALVSFGSAPAGLSALSGAAMLGLAAGVAACAAAADCGVPACDV